MDRFDRLALLENFLITGATALLLIISLVTLVYIAILAKSIWIGALLFVGLMCLIQGRGASFHGDYVNFFGTSVVGLTLVGIATWLTRFTGGWLWMPIWLLSAFLVGVGGLMTRALGKAAGSDIVEFFGNTGLIMGFLCGFLAFLGPWLWA